MKPGPVTKPDKKNTATSFDDDFMSANGNVIVFFWIYGKFAAIRKPNSGRMVYKISINNNILSYKTWKQNSKISNTAPMLLLWLKVLFLPKNADFSQKNAEISKIKKTFVLKGILSETNMCVLTCQISIS